MDHFMEEYDFISMNYRTGFQNESLRTENIFFPLYSDVKRFCADALLADRSLARIPSASRGIPVISHRP